MIVLDTDHVSLLEWDNEGAAELRERLADANPTEVATTIISYEEHIRGWMAYIARAKSISQQVDGYRRLRRHLENYRQIPILDFDEDAAVHYQQLRSLRLRVGAMDLKIASIVLAHNATLLSRNRSDFDVIPGLRVDDWTK